MLVISRKKKERIFITTASGERIVATIVALQGDKVRIGFEADRAFRIDREEIFHEIERKRQAAQAGEAAA